MTEQVELVGGYFSGETRPMRPGMMTYVEAVVASVDRNGVVVCRPVRYEHYTRDPANPRRFVYVQPEAKP